MNYVFPGQRFLPDEVVPAVLQEIGIGTSVVETRLGELQEKAREGRGLA
ncbi:MULTISPECIES: hypothetical protein [Actinoalloteichus]|nr:MULTISPECIES: hypothetical protein [Actinoalloteichus]